MSDPALDVIAAHTKVVVDLEDLGQAIDRLTYPESVDPAGVADVEWEAQLAEVLHDVMCDVSHHDRPPARCSRWPKYPNIAASVARRLPRPRADLIETDFDTMSRALGSFWRDGVTGAGHADKTWTYTPVVEPGSWFDRLLGWLRL